MSSLGLLLIGLYFGAAITRGCYRSRQRNNLRDFLLSLVTLYESSGKFVELNQRHPDPARENFVAVQEFDKDWAWGGHDSIVKGFEDAMTMGGEPLWNAAWLRAAPSMAQAMRDCHRLALAKRYIDDPVRNACR